MAILDLMPHLFPTGGGVSTLDLIASGHSFPFLRAHIWMIPVGLALASFVAAATKPAKPPLGPQLSRRVNTLVWGVVGVFCLILAAYFVFLKGV
jgi:hypothetical protein